jgi:hypothetical protein
MKKSKIITNIYGYAVCLTAMIVFLICIGQLVVAFIDLGDPLHSGWRDSESPSLASYENYKADILNSGKMKNTTSENYIPDDRTLRKMYKSALNDKIASENHRTVRDIYVNIILLLISIVLFYFHWQWMRKRTKKSKK